MNCSTPLFGKFCVECGQRDADLRRPAWTFLLEFIDDVFSLDSRLLRSLGPLVAKPGALSRRYVDGGRVSVLPPIRMLLVILVAFFLTMEITDVALVKIVGEIRPETQQATTPPEAASSVDGLASPPPASEAETRTQAPSDSGNNAERATAEHADSGAAAIVMVDEDINMTVQFFQPAESVRSDRLLNDEQLMTYLREQTGELEQSEREPLDFAGRIQRGVNAMAANPFLMNQVFNQWLPRALVILVPVLALFLWFFYWGSNSYYFNHLIFSLHLHAFMFLLLTVLVIVVPRVSGNVGGLAFFLGMPLYGLVAMKTMYRQGWIRTVFKFCLITGVYGLLLMLTLVGIMLYGLSEA